MTKPSRHTEITERDVTAWAARQQWRYQAAVLIEEHERTRDAPNDEESVRQRIMDILARDR